MSTTSDDDEQTWLEEDGALSRIFLDARDPIIVEDLEGKVLHVNPAAESRYGYSSDELEGKPITTLVPLEKRGLAEDMLRRCLAGEQVVDEEGMRVGKNGQVVNVLVTLSLIRDATDQARAVVSFAKDITQRRRAELEAARMARVFQNASDPIIIEDLSGIVLDLNQRAIEQYGYSREELVGLPIKTIVPSRRHEQADELLRSCLVGNQVRDIEGERQTKNQIVHPVLLSLSLLLDENGTPNAVASYAKDTSQLKEAEQLSRQYARELALATKRQGEFALLGRSPAVTLLRSQIERWSTTEVPLLLVCTPGCGEEAVARSLHGHSPRNVGPFVAVDCRHIADTGTEGTLFGRNGDKGGEHRASQLELARGGVLFLARAESLNRMDQLELLSRIEKSDPNEPVRYIVHTSVDPSWAAEEGRLDRRLAQQLIRARLAVPALMERLEDLPDLVEALVRQKARSSGKQAEQVSERSMEQLASHSWGGNLRELRGVVERAVEMSTGPVLEIPQGLLSGGIPVGGYLLKRQIGAGGMGEVWLAEHDVLRRPAAIKLIRADSLEGERREQLLKRFNREARATASLRSPNTVELYDYGATDESSLYYVMEHLEGLDAEQLVERFGSLPPERAIYLLIQATHSLEEAHGRGLVHRDIKPSNLFITMLGFLYDFIKVLDFGIVKALREESAMTKTQVSMGTPGYMAPEIIMEGAMSASAQSDVYSLGCVGYFLLSGQPPFAAPTALASLTRQSTEAAPSLSQVTSCSPELSQLIAQCMAISPDSRPQGMRELRSALSGLAEGKRWNRDQAEEWWKAHLPGIAGLTSVDALSDI